MEQELLEIREQQKTTWNKFSTGWKKWDELTLNFLRPMGDAIIEELNLNDTDYVLDVASGTGEPGLSIASQLRNGRVIITDLADDMLVVAHENAAKRGIRNVEFSACDVCELPFDDNTFDAISCRFGYMFFPDMHLATREMIRVLKPGGKISTTVWNVPEKNFWVTAVMGPMNRNMELPVPPMNAPGIFRCAQDGFIADLFSKEGLKNISQKEVASIMNCGTIDVYWRFMTEVVAPVVAALGKADKQMKAKIRNEVYEAVNQKYPDGNVQMDSSAWLISCEK